MATLLIAIKQETVFPSPGCCVGQHCIEPNTWTVATFFDCTVSLVTVFIALCRVAMASLMNYVQYSHTCIFQIQSQFCKQNCLLMSVYFHVCPKISKNKLWQIAFLKMQSGALWQNGLLEAKTWINVFPVFLTPSILQWHHVPPRPWDQKLHRFSRFPGADIFKYQQTLVMKMQMIHRKQLHKHYAIWCLYSTIGPMLQWHWVLITAITASCFPWQRRRAEMVPGCGQHLITENVVFSRNSTTFVGRFRSQPMFTTSRRQCCQGIVGMVES